MFARTLLTAALAGLAAFAAPQSLVLESTRKLNDALSASDNNTFHPQGLGFDESADELLFVQSGLSAIVRTDLGGNVLGKVETGTDPNAPGYRAVAVAADKKGYYVSDFFANRNGRDVYRLAKSGGALDSVGTETAAYLGTPLDVRRGNLFRTEASNGTLHSYNDLATVRVSRLSDPDAILRTLDLDTPGGIGDLTVDFTGNALYVLSYGEGDVYRYDLTTGVLLATYDLNLQSANAGLAYGSGKLYYYDWRSTGSSLTTYRVVPVPEPASLAALALGTLAFRRRRK